MGAQLYHRAFVTMALASLFVVSSFAGFFLFPIFITSHGGTKADIGILMGAAALSAVLCRPWISEMVDKVGRKRSYGIGCVIMTGLPLVYLLFRGDLADFYLPLILVRLLHGVGLAVCFTSAFTYIADRVPPARLNEGIGMFGITGLTGMAVGPFVAEMIVEQFGFSVFFVTASALALVGLLLQFTLTESLAAPSRETSPSFFQVMVRGKVLTVAVVAMLFGFGLAASAGFVTPFAKDQDLPFVSPYYLAYSGAAVVTRLLGGRLADRVGEVRIIPGALILTGLGMMALVFLGQTPVLVLSGVMSGCGHGFLFPCLNSLAIRNEPAQIRGKITGVFTGSIDAGVLVGSMALGYVGDWAGFRTLFLCAGLILLAGFGFFRLRAGRLTTGSPVSS
jgi:MFS family permease